jgi:hypothetical protein
MVPSDGIRLPVTEKEDQKTVMNETVEQYTVHNRCIILIENCGSK